MTENVSEFYQSISMDKQHLYITDNASDLSTYTYNVFQVFPEGSLSNLAYFGYWLTNSPIEDSILNRYHVTNPYTAALESHDVYIIDNTTINEKLNYIQEHYEPNAQLSFVECRNGFNIYQIRPCN